MAFNFGNFLGNLFGAVQKNSIVVEIETLAPQIASAVIAGGATIPAFNVTIGNQVAIVGPIPVAIKAKV